MDAHLIIEDVKRRLIAMAENPPYVFRDTPHELIEQYQRRLTTFVGYSESEVRAAEERLVVSIPRVFRTYLLEMGKSPGDLFRGSDLAGVEDFEQYRANALALMAETDPSLLLAPNAVVFLFHQGYAFVYLLAAGGFDGPILHYTETEREPREAAPTFAAMLDAELHLMETTDAASRASGGYYMTLHPGGGGSCQFPSLNSGERPLDRTRLDKP